ILILARMTSAFSGKSVSVKPVGGSESALFYLCRELAKLGHEIEIFNNCGNEAGIYEGVSYARFTTLADLVKHSKTKEYDFFISFRDLPAFLFGIKAKKMIWWGHDDFSNVWNYSDWRAPLGKAFLKLAGFLTNIFCDRLFVVSNWLGNICTEYLGIKKDKIYVTKNGVHLPYFNKPEPEGSAPILTGTGSLEPGRDPYRLVYTSVPARGLDILLDIFPKIKEKVPRATLHVYCGWDLGMLKEEDKKLARSLYDRTNQPGVIREGTKKHSDLAKDLMISSLMLYPSHPVPRAGFFAETSCIAALEAQAGGCPVVASKAGALPESVIDGKTGVLIEGSPYSGTFKEKFADETVKLLKDRERLSGMRKTAERFIRDNYTWEIIAKEWTQVFYQMLK
ncbi:MAG: glycosyltransferase family 4 protein, partial [Candidatus Margulisiibacteriota bacterium]